MFFSRLANEVERRGYALEAKENGLRIRAGGEVMVIAITEKTDRIPHVMTEKEEAPGATDLRSKDACPFAHSMSLWHDDGSDSSGYAAR